MWLAYSCLRSGSPTPTEQKLGCSVLRQMVVASAHSVDSGLAAGPQSSFLKQVQLGILAYEELLPSGRHSFQRRPQYSRLDLPTEWHGHSGRHIGPSDKHVGPFRAQLDALWIHHHSSGS